MGTEVLDERFGQVHVVGQIAEGHFGFDHPEFGQVPRGIGVLGAEGGAEGVDLAQRAGKNFSLQLSADG